MRSIALAIAILLGQAASVQAQGELAARMKAWSASLGVDCAHCHEPGNWTSAAKPAHAMVAKMMPIFEEIPRHFEKSRMPVTQCFMCHQGRPIPERRPAQK